MEDPRIKDVIQTFDAGQDFNIVIVGFPYDEGIRRNGGRLGAQKGPESFRKYVYKLCASDACLNLTFGSSNPVSSEHVFANKSPVKIGDAGDVKTHSAEALEEGHLLLEEQVFQVMISSPSRDCIPFVVGGGNDQSYPNARALLRLAAEQGKSVLVINLDAHLDVRPLKDGNVHSGSPFRLMLEDPLFAQCNGHFVEFASQGEQCSIQHVNYLKSRKNTQIYWLKDLNNSTIPVEDTFKSIIDQTAADYIFVSFDLDSVCAADSPGVSSSSPVGLTATQALKICQYAGSNLKVRLFDLSEYNPLVDEYQTGRLVAFMFHSFLQGYCSSRCV